MPKNVEIKARVKNVDDVIELASHYSDHKRKRLNQEDTFYKCTNGRLKLRTFSVNEEKESQTAQLIQYDRPDMIGPKTSNFHVTPISDPESLKITLERALGIMGVVKKERLLFMIGQTRVHIDKVENLGSFLEFEVVLYDEQSEKEGQENAEELMKKLQVDKDALIDCAYIDMILSR